MKGKERRNFWDLIRDASALSSVVAILIGLVVGFFVILASDPANAMGGFQALVTSGFGDMQNIGQMLYAATPILMTGLAVGFAGKTGLFNIGASGQFIVGAYCSLLVAIRLAFLPGPLVVFLSLCAAALGGALWGALPGILKAWRNVNEVISCIMMNYIGMFLVNDLVVRTIYDRRRNTTMRVPAASNLPTLGMDQIFRAGNVTSSANAGILIAILAAILMYIILDKTVLGFELKACGYNKDAAEYAGINSKGGIVKAMVISGALAGLGGAMLYLSGTGRGIDVIDVLAPEGFNGIPVALLGLNNPIGIIFSALFIGYLNVGGFYMQRFGYAPQVVDMIISIILYFSAFSLVIRGLLKKKEVVAGE